MPSLHNLRAQTHGKRSLLDSDYVLILFWIANAAVSIVVKQSSTLAAIHAVCICGVGIYLAIAGRRSEHIACALAFVVGSEVLWRMSKASVMYEVAKYCVALCSLIGFLRMRRQHVPTAALGYMLLLLPAAVIPLVYLQDTTRLRKQLSFNLSGPLAITCAMCFFANLSLTRRATWRMVLLMVTPIIGTAAVTVFTTYSVPSDELVFNTESNLFTSGGFGPNQVSTTLGLGAVLLLLYLADPGLTLRRRAIVSVGLLLCTVQSAMTFSRSGIYAALGAFVPAAYFLLADRRTRARVSFIVLGGAIGAFTIAIPYMQEFTGGAISDRFSETHLSGREQLASGDMQAFRQKPVYGVGIGMSPYSHWGGALSHNEFSRVLAEHGLLGIIALFGIAAYGTHRVMLATGPLEKAFVSAMFAWCFLFMMSNGFRIAAPALTLGMGCMGLQLDTGVERTYRSRRPATGGELQHVRV
jgi:hypothetical protein